MKIIQAGLINLKDTTELFDLYRQFYNQESDFENLRRFLVSRIISKESTILIAYEDDYPLGFIQLSSVFSSITMERVWLINDLFVMEDYRNIGIGSALLNAAAKFGKKSNAKWFLLRPGSENRMRHRLYEKNGWLVERELFHRFDI